MKRIFGISVAAMSLLTGCPSGDPPVLPPLQIPPVISFFRVNPERNVAPTTLTFEFLVWSPIGSRLVCNVIESDAFGPRYLIIRVPVPCSYKTFTVPAPYAGTRLFRLVVMDGQSESSYQDISVTLS